MTGSLRRQRSKSPERRAEYPGLVGAQHYSDRIRVHCRVHSESLQVMLTFGIHQHDEFRISCVVEIPWCIRILVEIDNAKEHFRALCNELSKSGFGGDARLEVLPAQTQQCFLHAAVAELSRQPQWIEAHDFFCFRFY